ncbi:MAG TPA: dephospho-CoA kinase [Burkholderiales bacterium]|nr:dephospho-CoA kinase [Burkholderiales bacterium]
MVKNIIGLTGLIGSGKSLAADYFAQLGVEIIDTDVISHILTSHNGRAIQKIKSKFGSDFITDNQDLNRDKMRNLVFNNMQARKDLEQIIHPLIYEVVEEQIYKSSSCYVIVVVPLLFNSLNYLRFITRSIFIDCKEEIIIKRVIKRSKISLDLLKSILLVQMPREEQIARADDIILNNESMVNLKNQVHSLFLFYNKLYGKAI